MVWAKDPLLQFDESRENSESLCAFSLISDGDGKIVGCVESGRVVRAEDSGAADKDVSVDEFGLAVFSLVVVARSEICRCEESVDVFMAVLFREDVESVQVNFFRLGVSSQVVEGVRKVV